MTHLEYAKTCILSTITREHFRELFKCEIDSNDWYASEDATLFDLPKDIELVCCFGAFEDPDEECLGGSLEFDAIIFVNGALRRHAAALNFMGETVTDDLLPVAAHIIKREDKVITAFIKAKTKEALLTKLG